MAKQAWMFPIKLSRGRRGDGVERNVFQMACEECGLNEADVIFAKYDFIVTDETVAAAITQALRKYGWQGVGSRGVWQEAITEVEEDDFVPTGDYGYYHAQGDA